MKGANVSFNYHDYLELPEDKRYEILQGELFVVPAPGIRHQLVARNLLVALYQHAKVHQSGLVLPAPCDVILSEENVVQPDILLVRSERGAIVTELNLQGAPSLAVEILSPSSRARDLGIKRKIYARFGVQEYWIVDPDASTVEVLVRGESGYSSAGIFGAADRLSSPLLPELNLRLAEIFEETTGR